MPTSVTPEMLSDHARFVRALSRSLLSNAHDAEDLAQQAWLVALEHPPRRLRWRGWFRTVLRNLGHKVRASDECRQQREQAVAQRAVQPTSAEIVEREELLQQVVTAVRSLDEPYRSAILLRFYEGLTPAEVAARQGVPVATVRSQVQRALATLRGRLDQETGGRSRWCLGLAPLVGVKLPPGPAITTTATAGPSPEVPRRR